MKKIIILTLIIACAGAQNVKDVFSLETQELSTDPSVLIQNNDLSNLENLTYTPLEKAIDPDTYILGPGDLLGINIVSVTNITAPVRVNPIGELMIPSVGTLYVNGVSLSDVKSLIKDYILKTAFKNADINVTLLDVRKFKIQILGAVQNPGYTYVTPADKVFDVILQSGGVEKFAHPEIIKVIRNGDTIVLDMEKYLSGKDLSQNIVIKQGDIIVVPLNEYAESFGLTPSEIKNNYIVVFGFVRSTNTNNVYQYYPGYTARDYIALAGGTKEDGASFKAGKINKTIIYRSNGNKVKNAIDELVLPGDMIEVPPSLLYQFVGGDGVLRAVTTLTSIASSIYIIDSIINKK